jgi:hypothetical protein
MNIGIMLLLDDRKVGPVKRQGLTSRGGRMMKRSSIPHDEDANARTELNKGMFSLGEVGSNMMI